MDFELVKNKKLENKFKITISANEIEEEVIKKVKEIQPELQLKGFRKGQVPNNLIRKMYGKNILGDVVQTSVDGSVSKLLIDQKHSPAAQPKIEILDKDWKEGSDLVLEVEYEALPIFKAIDFSKIKLTRYEAKVEKKSVEDAVNELAESASDYLVRKAGAKSKNKDQVIIDFSGTVDGEKFEGGTASDYPLVIGSNSFIPGFEEQLIGTKAGGSKDVKVSFPEDYGNKSLSGKKALFKCKIKEIKEPVKAKIDDNLAKKFGSETLTELRNQIKIRIENEYREAAKSLLKKRLMDDLDGKIKTELPQTLVENEAKEIAHQIWQQENPSEKGHDHPDVKVKEEHKKLASRRVKLGLFVADIGKNNNIIVSEEEINQFVVSQASQYPGQEKEYMEFISKNRQAKEQVKAPIFEEKVINFILGLANVSTKAISVDKLKDALSELE
ncbi:MAG: trigger factor [Paracoccaceae bacterium]